MQRSAPSFVGARGLEVEGLRRGSAEGKSTCESCFITLGSRFAYPSRSVACSLSVSFREEVTTRMEQA